jgi:hypothetical protein
MFAYSTLSGVKRVPKFVASTASSRKRQVLRKPSVASRRDINVDGVTSGNAVVYHALSTVVNSRFVRSARNLFIGKTRYLIARISQKNQPYCHASADNFKCWANRISISQKTIAIDSGCKVTITVEFSHVDLREAH